MERVINLKISTLPNLPSREGTAQGRSIKDTTVERRSGSLPERGRDGEGDKLEISTLPNLPSREGTAQGRSIKDTIIERQRKINVGWVY